MAPLQLYSSSFGFGNETQGFNITLMLRVLKASSMSTPTLLLLMAFVYDVFFVFVTPYLTRSGESIMVAAATGAAMTVKETIPMLFRIPSFNGDGEAILGFGDVVLPGILVTFLKECDARLEEDQSTTGLLSSLGGLTTASASMMLKSGQQQSTWWWRKGGRWGYHLTAIVGFFIGLQVTYVAMMWSQKGQPALLYLVPCTLIPVVLLASRRHELSLLWNGWGDLDGDYEEEDQDEDDRQDQKLGSGDRKELEGRLEIETSDI
ncbi:Signal peptide peptidase-like 2B [Gryganskiella cystojenkinii]|nr:Signal peptide peptidase-like 2B [Gryganskiella cystojenkinii]